jgi:hypothetical protein
LPLNDPSRYRINGTYDALIRRVCVRFGNLFSHGNKFLNPA